jgi:5-methylcytosine-specific restriction endonuclease McrA
MSKQIVLKLWNERYGNKEDVYDYSGRLMKKSAIGNPNSNYEPTLDHIRPISKGGKDVLENLIVCNRITNQEKAEKFSTLKTNDITFQAVRDKGNIAAKQIH